jgi:hypothetical protein
MISLSNWMLLMNCMRKWNDCVWLNSQLVLLESIYLSASKLVQVGVSRKMLSVQNRWVFNAFWILFKPVDVWTGNIVRCKCAWRGRAQNHVIYPTSKKPTWFWPKYASLPLRFGTRSLFLDCLLLWGMCHYVKSTIFFLHRIDWLVASWVNVGTKSPLMYQLDEVCFFKVWKYQR